MFGNQSNLNQFQGAFNSAEAVSGFSYMPSGDYEAILLEISYNAEKSQFERKFQFPSHNKEQKDWIALIKKDGTISEYNLGRLKTEMEVMNPALKQRAETDFEGAVMEYLQAARGQAVFVNVWTTTDKNDPDKKSSKILIKEFHGHPGGLSAPVGQAVQTPPLPAYAQMAPLVNMDYSTQPPVATGPLPF